MIILLSPAKTLDFESESPYKIASKPHFQKDADYLAAKLAKLKPSELGALMNISPKLSGLNAQRYADWKNAGSKQAVFAYHGDVYEGLDAATLSESEIIFAQDRLYILSGLYGLLKPLDEIKPYRIEMATGFATPKGDNLYKYWGNRITDQLKKYMKTTGNSILVNLASKEYYAAVNTNRLKARVVTPVFKDKSNGNYAIISFFAKKARGMMSRFIIQHAITDVEMLQAFDEDGYHFNHYLSKGDQWMFTRG